MSSVGEKECRRAEGQYSIANRSAVPASSNRILVGTYVVYSDWSPKRPPARNFLTGESTAFELSNDLSEY